MVRYTFEKTLAGVDEDDAREEIITRLNSEFGEAEIDSYVQEITVTDGGRYHVKGEVDLIDEMWLIHYCDDFAAVEDCIFESIPPSVSELELVAVREKTLKVRGAFTFSVEPNHTRHEFPQSYEERKRNAAVDAGTKAGQKLFSADHIDIEEVSQLDTTRWSAVVVATIPASSFVVRGAAEPLAGHYIPVGEWDVFEPKH